MIQVNEDIYIALAIRLTSHERTEQICFENRTGSKVFFDRFYSVVIQVHNTNIRIFEITCLLQWLCQVVGGVLTRSEIAV